MGSTFPKNQDIIKNMAGNGLYISNMPEELYYPVDPDSKRMTEWIDELVHAMNQNHKAVVSIIHARPQEAGIEQRIKKLIASLVKGVTDQVTIHELLIEGGSTTSEILKSLNITRLTPFQEIETGVIRMKVDTRPGLYLTTKPGSYAWPEKLWMQEEMHRFNAAI
jgi:uncharacterized protein YgbK (DUF1537 family)